MSLPAAGAAAFRARLRRLRDPPGTRASVRALERLAGRGGLALALVALATAAGPGRPGTSAQAAPPAAPGALTASTFDLASSYPDLKRVRSGDYLTGTNRYALSGPSPDRQQTSLWFEPLAGGAFRQFATSPFRDCHWDLLRWEPGSAGLLRYLATYAGCYADHTEIVFRPGIVYMPRSWTQGQRWTDAGTSATVYDDNGIPVCRGTNSWRSTVVGLTLLPDGAEAVHTRTDEVQTLQPLSSTISSPACPSDATTSFAWQENFYLATPLRIRDDQGTTQGLAAGLARSTGGNLASARSAGHPDWDSVFAGWMPLPLAGDGTLLATGGPVASASTGNTITLLYHAPARPLTDASLAITAPPGWTPPVAADEPGCTTSTAGVVSTNRQTITISGLVLSAGAQVRVTYGATAGGPCAAGDGASAPAAAGAPVWQAVLAADGEAPASLGASPTVDVDAADGSGTLTATPASVSPGSAGNELVFTYTAPVGGLSDGTLTLSVPPAWSPPVDTNGQGCSTSNTGTLTIQGQTIVVSDLSLAPNTSVVISYGAQSGGDCSAADGAVAPSLSGANTFIAAEASSPTGALTPLAGAASVEVAP